MLYIALSLASRGSTTISRRAKLLLYSVHSTVKPRYKHPEDEHILVNKHMGTGPKRILVHHKHDLDLMHMLLIDQSRNEVNTKFPSLEHTILYLTLIMNSNMVSNTSSTSIIPQKERK
jgi:hypothetical protein